MIICCKNGWTILTSIVMCKLDINKHKKWDKDEIKDTCCCVNDVDCLYNINLKANILSFHSLQ